MMKKLILASAMAGLFVALPASAASKLDGAIEADGTITATDCTLLSNNVSVKISRNVLGAYACSETTNSITAGACSTGGANKSRTETCSWTEVTPVTDPPTYIKNFTACADAPPAGAPPQVTVIGRVAFIGNSSGGKVASAGIGDICSSAAVRTSSNWPTQ